MAWFWLFVAGLFEVIFATCLKLSASFTKPIFTVIVVIAALLSFYCLNRAMTSIPIGIAYAVWVGIGAAGVAVVGILLFAEPIDFWRVFFIITLVASVAGLRLVGS